MLTLTCVPAAPTPYASLGDDVVAVPAPLADEKSQFLRFLDSDSKPPAPCTALGFFKKNKAMIPKIASVARIIFAIPTTSVPAERIFSRAKLVNAGRYSTAPGRFEKLVMGWANYKKLSAHFGDFRDIDSVFETLETV